MVGPLHPGEGLAHAEVQKIGGNKRGEAAFQIPGVVFAHPEDDPGRGIREDCGGEVAVPAL